jgi:hypothetical protein
MIENNAEEKEADIAEKKYNVEKQLDVSRNIGNITETIITREALPVTMLH